MGWMQEQTGCILDIVTTDAYTYNHSASTESLCEFRFSVGRFDVALGFGLTLSS